jgi:hypothetical protein
MRSVAGDIVSLIGHYLGFRDAISWKCVSRLHYQRIRKFRRADRLNCAQCGSDATRTTTSRIVGELLGYRLCVGCRSKAGEFYQTLTLTDARRIWPLSKTQLEQLQPQACVRVGRSFGVYYFRRDVERLAIKIHGDTLQKVMRKREKRAIAQATGRERAKVRRIHEAQAAAEAEAAREQKFEALIELAHQRGAKLSDSH